MSSSGCMYLTSSGCMYVPYLLRISIVGTVSDLSDPGACFPSSTCTSNVICCRDSMYIQRRGRHLLITHPGDPAGRLSPGFAKRMQVSRQFAPVHRAQDDAPSGHIPSFSTWGGRAKGRGQHGSEAQSPCLPGRSHSHTSLHYRRCVYY